MLRAVCADVEEFSSWVTALAERMLTIMRQAEGVGLAAPQVGVAARLFVCNPTGEPEDDLILVNPRLVDLEDAEEAEEGCLSLPGVTVSMRRATRVVAEAVDTGGRPFRFEARGVLAKIIQHEVDHLDGKLIIDRMSEADAITNRRAIKQLEEQYESQRS